MIKYLFNVFTGKLDMIDDSVGVPSAPDTSIQFNDGGVFGGSKLLYTEPDSLNSLVKLPDQTIADEDGITLTIQAGQGKGFGYGGYLNLNAGSADPAGDFPGGGDVNINSGNGGLNGDGGYILLALGNPGTGADAGNIDLLGPLVNDPTSTFGQIQIYAGSKYAAIPGSTVEGQVRIRGMDNNGGDGGPINIQGGNADVADLPGTGNGGDINLTPGQGGGTSGDSGNLYAFLQNAQGGNGAGGSIDLEASNGHGSGDGGYAELMAGSGGATGNGGELILKSGFGGASGGNGGNVELFASGATGGDGDGGNILFQVGAKTGSGTHGRFIFTGQGGGLWSGILDFDSIASSDKTFTFPNQSGTIALTTGQTYTETNVTTDRSYDANATTINELADVLGTLLADLRSAGIIN